MSFSFTESDLFLHHPVGSELYETKEALIPNKWQKRKQIDGTYERHPSNHMLIQSNLQQEQTQSQVKPDQPSSLDNVLQNINYTQWLQNNRSKSHVTGSNFSEVFRQMGLC